MTPDAQPTPPPDSAPGRPHAVTTAPPRSQAGWLPKLDRREMAAIFAGGAIGTLARAALAEAFPHPATGWPWPTFVVNIVAVVLLGYFVTRLTERLPLSSYRRPLLGTGLCGGLSTFSTMQVEILKMIEARAFGLAIGYTVASVIAGYAAVHATTALVRRVRIRP